MEIPRIEHAKGLRGKRVLVRASLNAPVANGKVVDNFRLRAMLPTLEYLEKKGAKIILIGHIGRDPKETLKPVADHFNNKLGKTVGFSPELYGADLEDRIKNLGNGQMLMLENLRKFPGETENKMKFARHLATLGEAYVNDCFGDAHRKHASIVGLPKLLPAYAGKSLQNEVKHLEKALDPKHPFLFIVGGAKFETKIPLLRKFVTLADTVLIAGALVNDVFKARGLEVGKSVVSGDFPYAKMVGKKKNVLTPVDVVVTNRGNKQVRMTEDVKKGDMIVDAGPETVKLMEEEVRKAKFILWNGPLGFYEEGYDEASRKLLKAIAQSRSKSIIGGGDTVALVSKMKMEDDFTFVSAGGGAMLEFLQNGGKLPGLGALQRSQNI